MRDLERLKKLRKKEQQRSNRLGLQLNRTQKKVRSADFSRKLILGWRLIVTGLCNEDRDVVLGLLHEAKLKLQGSNADEIRKQWREIGEENYPDKRLR